MNPTFNIWHWNTDQAQEMKLELVAAEAKKSSPSDERLAHSLALC